MSEEVNIVELSEVERLRMYIDHYVKPMTESIQKLTDELQEQRGQIFSLQMSNRILTERVQSLEEDVLILIRINKEQNQ